MTSYPGRWLVLAGQAGWALCVLYVIACWVAPHVVGTAGCELAPGSSVFGTATTSWLPPGTTCTYDLSEHGLPANVVTRPSELRFVVLAAALLGQPLLAHLRRLLSRTVPVEA